MSKILSNSIDNSNYINLFDGLKYFQDLPYYYKDIIYSKIRYYMQPYININYNISKINDNIYISDLPTAFNKDKIKEEGITHILSTIIGLDPLYPEDFIYKTIPIRDIESQDLSEYFDECVNFMDDAIKNGGKVLVHCSYGVSRSVSMVIAYLIKKDGMSYNEAYQFLKSKRGQIEPNKGFKKQLLVYEMQQRVI